MAKAKTIRPTQVVSDEPEDGRPPKTDNTEEKEQKEQKEQKEEETVAVKKLIVTRQLPTENSVKEILRMAQHRDGTLLFVVCCNEDDQQYAIPTAEANERCPKLVIRFYESKVLFTSQNR